MSYGRPFSPTRPFAEQFAELQAAVPRVALFNIKSIDSDYCNMAYHNKGCYLLFGCDFNEDCCFGTLSMHNRSCLDCDYSVESELCYMIGDCAKCYHCQYVFYSKECTDCAYCYNCSGCNDCLLCHGLIGQSYCIGNVRYSPEEYEQKKHELLTGSWHDRHQRWQEFSTLVQTQAIHRFAQMTHAVDCSGDHIYRSKNCQNCFDIADSEDLQDVIYATRSRDCYRSGLLGEDTQYCYNTQSVVRVYNVNYSFAVTDSNDIDYTDWATDCRNCFGCVGIRNKQHCILNVQYSPEEYRRLRAQIVAQLQAAGEWGRFMPPALSCFGYNETTALEYYPLTRDQALATGFRWRESDGDGREPASVEIPDQIADVPETITGERLRCVECGKNYKIVRLELAFYQQEGLPIPRRCPNCRHALRLSLRNSRTLYHRQCLCQNTTHGHSGQCPTEFETTYSPDRPEKVYCEACYQKEIY